MFDKAKKNFIKKVKDAALLADQSQLNFDSSAARLWQDGATQDLLNAANLHLRQADNDLAGLYWRARALDRLGRSQEAISAYRMALRQIPKQVVAVPVLSGAGVVFYYLNRATSGGSLMSLPPGARRDEVKGLLVDLLVRESMFAEAIEHCRVEGDDTRAEEVMEERDRQAVEVEFAKLDSFIGLDSVKEQVRNACILMKYLKDREKNGLPPVTVTWHLVFTGNPGTGKTTIARKVGDVYKALGILKGGHFVEASPGDLVAGFIGQTVAKTQSLIDRAMDGVLFIDEAYGLLPRKDSTGTRAGDFEESAIRTLLKAMEDHRDRLIVIVAGYEDDMQLFLASNDGLEERFKTFIHFPDYSNDDLTLILQQEAENAGCTLAPEARTAATALFSQMERQRGFANGRTARNVWQECLSRQANRLAVLYRPTRRDYEQIVSQDVPTWDQWIRNSSRGRYKANSSRSDAKGIK